MKIYSVIFILSLSTVILLVMLLQKNRCECQEVHIGQRPVSAIEANVYKRSLESIAYVNTGLIDLGDEIVELDGIGETDKTRIIAIIDDCKNLNQNTLGWIENYHEIVSPTPIVSNNLDSEE